jgi:hypothetical protein
MRHHFEIDKSVVLLASPFWKSVKRSHFCGFHLWENKKNGLFAISNLEIDKNIVFFSSPEWKS